MAKTIEVTIENVDDAKFQRIQSHVSAQLGFNLVGKANLIEKSGVRVSWNYDDVKKTLELTCDKWPIFMGPVVESRLRALQNV